MEPDPYKIGIDETLGRHLVATKPIQNGTIIIKEAPIIKGPFLQTFPTCVGCGKMINEKNSHPCTKCGWPVCGKKCENNKNHEAECVLTQARGTPIAIKNFGVLNPNFQFVTILRALYLKKTLPETWDKLMQLQGHPIANVAPPGFIKSLFKLEDWSESEIQKVAEILTVNGHELPLTQPPQLVVYASASLLEHSCRANCTKTFTNDGEVLVIAAEDVGEGDHLSICYTDPFWGVENRRQHLHQSKHFWCSCQRCQDPSEMESHLNSLKCPNLTCEGFVLPKTFLEEVKTWTCSCCDGIFADEKISLLVAKIGAELAQLPKNDPDVCRAFIKKYDRILAPTHFYMVDVKMALSHMFTSDNYEDLSNGDLKLLLKMTQELKTIAEKLAPAEKRFKGLILYRLAKTKIEAARRKEDEAEFRSVLQESKRDFSEARLLLSNEPTLLPEGRVHMQIALELKLIEDLLNKV